MTSFFSLQSLGAFALVLGLLVLIHELGHFTVAKLLGIRVEVFSIGFGPRLFGIRREKEGWRFSLLGTRSAPREPAIDPDHPERPETPAGTDYRVSLLPLGGYVKMLGENPDERLSGRPEEFMSRRKWQRFAVLVMGPATNIVAAVALMAVVYHTGIPEPAYLSRPAVVGAVDPESPAARAGVEPNDRIRKLGSKVIRDWNDLLTAVTLSPGSSKTLEMERGRETLTREIRLESVTAYQIGYAGILPVMPAQVLQVEPGFPAEAAGLKAGDRIVTVGGRPISHPEIATRIFQKSAGIPIELEAVRDEKPVRLTVVPVERGGQGKIGITWNQAPEERIRKYPWAGSLVESFRWNWKNVDLVFTTLGKLFTRQLSLRTMSGPIDIYRISGQTLREGWNHFLQFMALVSLQLGVINLLPFPVLDGGHILILGIEGVIRRDLSLRIKERVMQVGFYLLLLLMGAIVYLDISKNFLER